MRQVPRSHLRLQTPTRRQCLRASTAVKPVDVLRSHRQSPALTGLGERHRSAGFNSLGQSPEGFRDGLLGVVLPYPFLQRRRKWQRLARFKTEGTNEAEGRLRHVGGLYLERGVALSWRTWVAE